MDILILVNNMEKFVKTLEKKFALNGDYIFKEIKVGMSKRHFNAIFTVALVIIAKSENKLQCPSIGEWKKKMWYVYSMEH